MQPRFPLNVSQLEFALRKANFNWLTFNWNVGKHGTACHNFGESPAISNWPHQHSGTPSLVKTISCHCLTDYFGILTFNYLF